MILDPIALIKAAGYAGLFLIVFAESGLLVGFFLPGDSLLFAAGFLASQGYLNIYLLAPMLFVAAIAGDNLGYWLGRKMGPKIFKKDESVLFRHEHAERAEAFFAHHGPKAIILARFVPVIRTFTPVIAGVGKMGYRLYFLFDLIGGLLWAVAITLIGYFLGSRIPNIDAYLLPIVIVIIIASLIPTWMHLMRARRRPN